MTSDRAQPAPAVPASDFVRIEAAALLDLALRLDTSMKLPFDAAVNRLLEASSSRSVLLSGIGKSGLIAQKIAATLRSTGTQAHFLHPTEAVHGDLGMVARNDTVLVLSYSGETEELLNLLPAFQQLSIKLIALCGSSQSTLAQASHVFLDVSVNTEACPLNLAPTASTTVMLALGDALALELSRRRGFDAANFADLHPGGRLGNRLARVKDLMHSGDALPFVLPETPMPQVIYEMSRKKLGMTTVLEGGRLRGMISDGDLRRLLERDGNKALDHTAAEMMNAAPLTIHADAFAQTALEVMETRKITSLIVVEGSDQTSHEQVLGVLHLHDLWSR